MEPLARVVTLETLGTLAKLATIEARRNLETCWDTEDMRGAWDAWDSCTLDRCSTEVERGGCLDLRQLEV